MVSFRLLRAGPEGEPPELRAALGGADDQQSRFSTSVPMIDTGTNKRFVRRNERGTSFKKVVDAGKSITRDKRTKAKRKVASGQGDRGDGE